MTNINIKKLRTVNLNERGQIVIPEDIRKDFGIKGNDTLIIMERNGEIILKKEEAILDIIENEDKFWRALSIKSMETAWCDEDDIWDKFHKDSKK